MGELLGELTEKFLENLRENSSENSSKNPSENPPENPSKNPSENPSETNSETDLPSKKLVPSGSDPLASFASARRAAIHIWRERRKVSISVMEVRLGARTTRAPWGWTSTAMVLRRERRNVYDNPPPPSNWVTFCVIYC